MHGPRLCLLPPITPPTISSLVASTSSPFPPVESVAISHFWNELATVLARSTGHTSCASLAPPYAMSNKVSVLTTNMKRVLFNQTVIVTPARYVQARAPQTHPPPPSRPKAARAAIPLYFLRSRTIFRSPPLPRHSTPTASSSQPLITSPRECAFKSSKSRRLPMRRRRHPLIRKLDQVCLPRVVADAAVSHRLIDTLDAETEAVEPLEPAPDVHV